MTQVSEEKIVEASVKITQVLDMVAGMTLLEAAQLVKAFEQKFGVSAAAVAAVPTGAAAWLQRAKLLRQRKNQPLM